MKIVRYRFGDTIDYGIIDRESIRELQGDVFGDFRKGSEVITLKEATLLAPCQPSKIIAIGLNYRDHAREVGMAIPKEPLLFLKPSTSVIGPDEKIIYPSMSTQVDYEAELGVVIRKRCKNVPINSAKDYILGYTCFNDVTARDLQKIDRQWTRAKGFDTFAPIGPWIVTDITTDRMQVESYLNGELKQSSTTDNLIFNCYQLLSFISHIMTLLPGDIIATGTPSGIGPMHVGDRIDIVVEGIGTLTNYVAK